MFSRTAPPSILSSRSTTSMLDCATRFLRTYAPIELAIRSLLGYHLGALDPLIHLDASKLSATASNPSKRTKGATEHDDWVRKYRQALRSSREDFVEHHRSQYDGVLPVWVAVEVMDWGMLSHLYRFTPNPARNRIARECNMSGPQLESWLKSLNILRNYSAHHARLWSSPVEWCNRFVSFGVGYALSWSGGSSCWVGWGVSRDLVRMSRLR